MGLKNVLAIKLLKIAVNRTSPKALQERLREEWLAYLDALPDGLPKLSAAAGFLWSTLHQANEKIRLFLFIHSEAICLMFFLHAFGKIDYSHMLSACGIVLGFFGTLVLYWEPIATNQTLEFINDGISYSGNSMKLARDQMCYITFFAVLGALQACAYSYLIVQEVKHNVLGLPPALTIGLVCIVFACPSFGMYVLAKMERRQCSRWLEKLETARVSSEEARYAEIRRILRLVGYASLCMAAIAQLPTTLF